MSAQVPAVPLSIQLPADVPGEGNERSPTHVGDPDEMSDSCLWPKLNIMEIESEPENGRVSHCLSNERKIYKKISNREVQEILQVQKFS